MYNDLHGKKSVSQLYKVQITTPDLQAAFLQAVMKKPSILSFLASTQDSHLPGSFASRRWEVEKYCEGFTNDSLPTWLKSEIAQSSLLRTSHTVTLTCNGGRKISCLVELPLSSGESIL